MQSNRWQGSAMAAALLFMSACSSAPKETAPQPETVPMRSGGGSSSADNSSGLAVGHDSSGPATSPMSAGRETTGKMLRWSAPSTWKLGPEKPMRAATYLIPAAGGDSEGGECAIFVDIGGGVQANIDRWIGQFSQPDGSPSAGKAKQKQETVNGYPVTTVELTGIYNASGMGMGQPSPPKTGYKLLGAIVEGPSGEVFFKLTGPEKTMAAAQKDFQALLKSIN